MPNGGEKGHVVYFRNADKGRELILEAFELIQLVQSRHSLAYLKVKELNHEIERAQVILAGRSIEDTEVWQRRLGDIDRFCESGEHLWKKKVFRGLEKALIGLYRESR